MIKNTEAFPVGASDYEALGLLYMTMISVDDYSKAQEVLGCKEVTSLGVSVWYVEGITEVIMIGTIESIIEWISPGLLEWCSKDVREQNLI